MGEPHNIIRHPDMLSCGVRRYVVHATAGRQLDGNGEKPSAEWRPLLGLRQRYTGLAQWVLTGYISVRTVPSRDEITQSESLYQKINSQQFKGFRLF